MGGRHERDPFDDVVLDDAFVRGGPSELSASTRAALAPPSAPSGRSRLTAPQIRRTRRRLGRGRVWTLALVLVAVLAVPALIAAHHRASQRAAAAGHAPTVGLVDQAYVRGGCYTWDQRVALAQARLTPCAGSHLFEAVATTTLTGYAGKPYPTDAQWDPIFDRVCGPAVTRYLGHTVTPMDAVTTTGIHPDAGGWREGARRIQCGLGSNEFAPVAELVGRNAPVDTPVRGRARTSPRWWTPTTGVCTADRPFGPAPRAGLTTAVVPCTDAHTAQYVGAITISASHYPSADRQTDLSFDRCQTLADRYAGRHVTQTSTRYVGGWIIDPVSWAAGDRTVACEVAYSTGTRDVPETGSIRA